ncbi:MAG: hypothetical protein ABW321_06765 [Polyangiales bacterium]
MHQRTSQFLQTLDAALGPVVDAASALDEIAAWLRAQPGVELVQVSDYVLKSWPPQRELIFHVRLPAGELVQRIARIEERGPRVFSLHDVRTE